MILRKVDNNTEKKATKIVSLRVNEYLKTSRFVNNFKTGLSKEPGQLSKRVHFGRPFGDPKAHHFVTL